MKTFTEYFFDWATERQMISRDIASELGKKLNVVSNWRSKGIPKSQHHACQMLINKKDAIDLLGSKRLDVVKILNRSIH